MLLSFKSFNYLAAEDGDQYQIRSLKINCKEQL